MNGVEKAPQRSKPDLGIVLLSGGYAELALPHLHNAAKKNPLHWGHWSNLSVAYRIVGDYEQAKYFAGKALRLNKKAAEAWSNFANILTDTGEFADALDCLTAAYNLSPKNAQICFNLACALLRVGKWKEAWLLWEIGRFHTSWFELPKLPIWEGQPLAGKKLLILKEGGYGDTFLFMRWFPELQDAGAELTLYVWDKQAVYLEGHPWINHIVLGSGGIDPTKFDFQVALMSIPTCLVASPDAIPQAEKYLFGDKERVKLPANGKPLVGICWEAEENGVPKRSRSIPTDILFHLKEMDITWISLCPDAEETPEWIEKVKLEDWRDTASVVENLDLVISVDTAVAHLAGAMGKLIWTIVPKGSDWKWFMPAEGEHSPFYPSMRVFRNDHVLTWQGTVKKVAEELEAWMLQAT
jgi:hypothetical protein